ncbi:MAG: phosphopantothenoylcysteine decarboxylase [Candidatus Ancillula sp.]|jgi:phosphopantothenoylcysteine decarboxylase|nr:phosphopantothenoylcysteine decarboxylase [Candidatus Ancillula sp.]
MEVLLGVSGSISAYKAADIVSALKKRDIDTHVVMTKHATAFITKLTLQALSQNEVYVDVLDEPDPDHIAHIALPQKVSVFCLAPASANVIAKIAHGIADDQLTSMVLALPSSTSRLIAPAMNTQMLENPATRANIAILKERGWSIIPSRVTRLACGVEGDGALAKVEDIVEAIITSVQ